MEYKTTIVDGDSFRIVDSKGGVTMADSFVKGPQKLGKGHGEGKLFLATEGPEIRSFAGEKGFVLRCFFKKSELISFLESLEHEYMHPQLNYRKVEDLPSLYTSRLRKLENLEGEYHWFEMNEQTQLKPPRIYVNSSDPVYALMRELSLPGFSYLSLMKLEGENNAEIFHARLFASGLSLRDSQDSSDESVGIQVQRKGQPQFRKEVLGMCSCCPITNVDDPMILIAAHIKPFNDSALREKYNPLNGIPMTPTVHALFDAGMITIDSDQKLLISSWLSKDTAEKLGLVDGKQLNIKSFEKRKEYFDFRLHKIFKST